MTAFCRVRLRRPSRTPRRLWSAGLRSLAVCAFLFTSLPVSAEDPTPFAAGDVMRGWRVFHTKKCVDCHAIWDEGGHVGPDLGRIRTGRLTDAGLAGVMWNHIPKMLGWMEETGRQPTTLTNDDMADLFALVFFVRQLDERGDPVRGEAILRQKGCSECHTTDSTNGSVGPDLAKWGRYVNPIAWAQMMWEHAPMMEEAMERSGIQWPKLEGTDLVHLVAYVRSIGIAGEKTYLRPGSVSRGAELFKEKECQSCHPGTGPDLATAELPSSLGAIASGMWNHSPDMMRVMREQAIERQPVTSQELADILAYVLALSAVERGGDRTNGERVFARKGCLHCHEGGADDTIEAPDVASLQGDAAPVAMATAMWNHGATMLERMTEAGLSWPVFNDDEMADLLMYLAAAKSASTTEGSKGE